MAQKRGREMAEQPRSRAQLPNTLPPVAQEGRVQRLLTITAFKREEKKEKNPSIGYCHPLSCLRLWALAKPEKVHNY